MNMGNTLREGFIMKKVLIFTFVLILVAGCKTTLKVNNRTDPKSFDPVFFGSTTTHYYRELTIDVPEEIRSDEFDVSRVDMFADIYAAEIINPAIVEIYVGLEPGESELSNREKNYLIARDTLTSVIKHRSVAVKSPRLVLEALKQERFYIKAVINTGGSTVGMAKIENVYLDMWLERETNGLFPFFYFF